jgi:phage-related minor tail protein
METHKIFQDGKLSIVKMLALSKLIYRLNAILIVILTVILKIKNWWINKFIKCKGPETETTNFKGTNMEDLH